jgi:hypothetical protein
MLSALKWAALKSSGADPSHRRYVPIIPERQISGSLGMARREREKLLKEKL